ncbi:MAG: signal recognition particle protein [Planctomycetes bacterium]|nr:signal recognition particle protein [Planctomycetota bacterium]
MLSITRMVISFIVHKNEEDVGEVLLFRNLLTILGASLKVPVSISAAQRGSEGVFDNLQKGLSRVFSGFGRKKKITEEDLKETLREIRKVLLEADVALSVVREFLSKVEEKAIGADILKDLKPEQTIVGIINDVLCELMGPVDHAIPYNTKRGVTVVMMCGLQGSGKTTTCGKLAKWFVKKSNKPLLVAADLQRPGAVEQLRVVGESIGVSVYSEEKGRPQKVCQRAVAHAIDKGFDVVILDTAGRLAIDEELMRELKDIHDLTTPEQVYLVCDGMLGQDAVKSAKGFADRFEIDGIIMTKLDGDARGGAALTVKSVVGKPIKWIGTGEKLEALEEFHPDRIASRILGMGDVVSLVETVKEKVDQEKAQAITRKMFEDTFTFDDFLTQIQMIENMGPLKNLMKMIPGAANAFGDAIDEMDGRELVGIRALIQSMSFEERMNPSLLETHPSAKSRRARIERGAGAPPTMMKTLLKQFQDLRDMMKLMTGQSGIKGALGRRMEKSMKKQRVSRAEDRGLVDKKEKKGLLGRMFGGGDEAEFSQEEYEAALKDAGMEIPKDIKEKLDKGDMSALAELEKKMDPAKAMQSAMNPAARQSPDDDDGGRRKLTEKELKKRKQERKARRKNRRR